MNFSDLLSRRSHFIYTGKLINIHEERDSKVLSLLRNCSSKEEFPKSSQARQRKLKGPLTYTYRATHTQTPHTVSQKLVT